MFLIWINIFFFSLLSFCLTSELGVAITRISRRLTPRLHTHLITQAWPGLKYKSTCILSNIRVWTLLFVHMASIYRLSACWQNTLGKHTCCSHADKAALFWRSCHAVTTTSLSWWFSIITCSVFISSLLRAYVVENEMRKVVCVICILYTDVLFCFLFIFLQKDS